MDQEPQTANFKPFISFNINKSTITLFAQPLRIEHFLSVHTLIVKTTTGMVFNEAKNRITKQIDFYFLLHLNIVVQLKKREKERKERVA